MPKLPFDLDPLKLEQLRSSLLKRLRALDVAGSFQEFFETHWKLIYAVAVRAGLSGHDAQMVVQEIFTGIARNLENFRYEPETSSFKAWLMRITRGCIDDKRFKFIPHNDFMDLWDAEWERNLIDLATERVKRKVPPEHYQVFHLHARKGLPARRVAEFLGVRVPKVYFLRLWIARLVGKEVRALRRKGGEWFEAKKRTKPTSSKEHFCLLPRISELASTH